MAETKRRVMDELKAKGVEVSDAGGDTIYVKVGKDWVVVEVHHYAYQG